MLLLTLSAIAGSPPSFAGLFQGGAVLQRDTDVAVWGGDAGSASLSLYVDGKHAADATVKEGNSWSARLPAHGVAFGSVLTAVGAGGNASVTVNFGDVVLCSGQSSQNSTRTYNPLRIGVGPHVSRGFESRLQQIWTCRW